MDTKRSVSLRAVNIFEQQIQNVKVCLFPMLMLLNVFQINNKIECVELLQTSSKNVQISTVEVYFSFTKSYIVIVLDKH